jgi:hypothetical protein
MHPRVSSRVVHYRFISRFMRVIAFIPTRGHLRNEKVRGSSPLSSTFDSWPTCAPLCSCELPGESWMLFGQCCAHQGWSAVVVMKLRTASASFRGWSSGTTV